MRHKDTLGDRMKEHYESRTRSFLPRRTYTILRVDGKAFHTYTRDCVRPFDTLLMEDMDFTAVALCRQISGVKMAFVQSDEISLVLTDFESSQTEAWFNGNIQKLVSLSASIAAAHFNSFRWQRTVLGHIGASEIPGGNPFFVNLLDEPVAYFDSRAFSIPDPVEVENYFVWRQQDATRNSISMTAQAHFPHERLQNKSSDEMQEMLWQEKGINWNDLPGNFKRGRCIVPQPVTLSKDYVEGRTGETKTAEGVIRHTWQPIIPPIFTREREWLQGYIPRLGNS